MRYLLGAGGHLAAHQIADQMLSFLALEIMGVCCGRPGSQIVGAV